MPSWLSQFIGDTPNLRYGGRVIKKDITKELTLKLERCCSHTKKQLIQKPKDERNYSTLEKAKEIQHG